MCNIILLLHLHSGQTVGGWSSEGIIQDSSPGLPVLCNSTHLTSFAVLVSSEKGRVRKYSNCVITLGD